MPHGCSFQDDAPSTAEYLLRGRAVYDRLQCDDEDILGVLDNRLAEVCAVESCCLLPLSFWGSGVTLVPYFILFFIFFSSSRVSILPKVAEALEAAGDSIDNYVETATEGLEHIRPLTSGAGGGGSSPGASSTT